jgi:hypothetical protein
LGDVQNVTARFTDNVISTVFLLNRVFKPFYKWAFRRMTELPVLGREIGDKLKTVAGTCGLDAAAFDALQKEIGGICTLLIAELHRQKLAFSDDWFMTTHGEEIQQSIQNSFLRALPAQYE